MELRNIGHYQIEASLRSGMYADVYRAKDTVRMRTVALKALKPGSLPGGVNLLRLLERAGLASDLVHPHIAWVWETGEADGYPYLAERYVNGPSLSEILKSSGPLPWGQAVTILQQIAQGLDFAHEKGWRHGDVNPGNILLSPDLGGVLINIGLANALWVDQLLKPANLPGYSPPEILAGEPPSAASDQYNLARLLVEVTTGLRTSESPLSLEVEEGSYPSSQLPRVWPQGVPWGIVTVLERALARDPAERFPNVASFADAAAKLEVLSGDIGDGSDPRQAEAQAWREKQAAYQRQAEEAARLAAVEQARQEIDKELRRDANTPVQQFNEVSQETPLSTALEIEAERPPPTVQRRRLKRAKPRRRIQTLLIAISILITALAGFWLNENFSGALIFPPTPTPTSRPTSTTIPPTQTTAASSTATSTHTQTITPSGTSTFTSTPTNTLTVTPTNTNSPTPTQIPTDTNEPRDRERGLPISLPIRPP